MKRRTKTYGVKFYGWDNNRESVEKSYICFQTEALDETDAREKVLENKRYRVGSPIVIRPKGVSYFNEVGHHPAIANIILDYCGGLDFRDQYLPERLEFDKDDLPAMVEWIRVAVGSSVESAARS